MTERPIKAPDIDRIFIDAIESGEVTGDVIELDAEGREVPRKVYSSVRGPRSTEGGPRRP